jgi:hypothetical protein
MRGLLRSLKADFAVTEIELLSPLPHEECIRRIREEVSWLPVGSGPMVGRVRKDHIVVCKRINGSNAFQTQLTATFIRKGQETRIYCQFGVRPSVAIFFVVWFTMIGLFAAAAVVSLFSALVHLGKGLGAGLLGVLFTAALLGFGGALAHLSRHAARDEQAFLIDILQTKLDARPSAQATTCE